MQDCVLYKEYLKKFTRDMKSIKIDTNAYYIWSAKLNVYRLAVFLNVIKCTATRSRYVLSHPSYTHTTILCAYLLCLRKPLQVYASWDFLCPSFLKFIMKLWITYQDISYFIKGNMIIRFIEHEPNSFENIILTFVWLCITTFLVYFSWDLFTFIYDLNCSSFMWCIACAW